MTDPVTQQSLRVAVHEISVLRSIIEKLLDETGSHVKGDTLNYAYDEYSCFHTFTAEELELLTDLGPCEP